MNRAQYAPFPASATEICQLWSAHMDSLERHLSANTWALTAVAVVLGAYPITRIVMPMVHAIVPEVVRNVLHFL